MEGGQDRHLAVARLRPPAAGGTKWRLSKNKTRPGQGPRKPKFSPRGRRLCRLSQSTREAQHPLEMSTKPNRPPRTPQPRALTSRSSPSIRRVTHAHQSPVPSSTFHLLPTQEGVKAVQRTPWTGRETESQERPWGGSPELGSNTEFCYSTPM